MIGIVLVAALVAVLVIWGRPRRSRSGTGGSVLLGAADDRTAAQLRADADRAAREEDWAAAIVLRYRAIARALMERDLLVPRPRRDRADDRPRGGASPFPDEARRSARRGGGLRRRPLSRPTRATRSCTAGSPAPMSGSARCALQRIRPIGAAEPADRSRMTA